MKHIVVSEENWLLLNHLKGPTDTFDDVVSRLLKGELKIQFPDWFRGEVKQIKEYLSHLPKVAQVP